jgi:hypothetical protein
MSLRIELLSVQNHMNTFGLMLFQLTRNAMLAHVREFPHPDPQSSALGKARTIVYHAVMMIRQKSWIGKNSCSETTHSSLNSHRRG